MAHSFQQVGFYNNIFEKETTSQLKSYVGRIDQMLSSGAKHPDKHWRDTKVLLKKLKEVVIIKPEDLEEIVDPPERRPTEVLSIRTMKPVAPEVTSILRESEYPTEKYMKERSKKSPEDKFYCVMCENWRYGWQLKESRLMRHKVFPKVNMRRSFFRINGIQPDPENYRQPNITKINVCNAIDL